MALRAARVRPASGGAACNNTNAAVFVKDVNHYNNNKSFLLGKIQTIWLSGYS